MGTPNGAKCTVLLEELVDAYPGFDYDGEAVVNTRVSFPFFKDVLVCQNA